MQTVEEVMAALRAKGTEQTRKTYRRHGMPDNMFGVKIGDLKPIARQIRGNQQLALELYETGNYDAMYLAGMVADGARMTMRQLQAWARDSTCAMLSEYAVAGVAAEHPRARDLAVKWIDARKDLVATAGWSTYSLVVATRADEQLDLPEIERLLKRVVDQIDRAPNRVRYAMNGFVISVGTYVKPLWKPAKNAAKQLGTVSVDVGDTGCKVPVAADYLAKVESMGRVGKKRKSPKC